ncbi:MAG: HAMP domain-containing protein, partial [Candidatus Obscuribacterales bacterium]|nr:HAMP domain-containing protein [Steroidobacteraceae bacterium]
EPIDAARRGASSAIWFHATANEPSIVRAAVPILNGDRVAGVMAVEQPGEQLLTQRDAALERLLALTLLTTGFAMGLSLVFGLWLARRIRRLSKAAAHALSPEGYIEQRLPDTAARDELGDLARSYATLLGRLKDYTQYLQTLGAKLTHELRTPLAIVSSSLDNLTAEQTNINAQQYILRARDGANRLHSILTAMSEATRVEQSIEQAERVEFDLAALIRTAGQAYQQTFQTHRIAVQTPSGPCWIRGAPELIAQLLDKLVDNAIDFCPAGGRIDIELQCDSKSYRLNVSNEGPSLPAELADKVFDAMVSNRVSRSSGDARRPHLGLGLYIVQLIARFHRGQVRARNLPEQRGVAFEIQVPRL